MPHQSKSSYIFVIILATTIIGGVWVFGLDEKLFGSSYNKTSFAEPTYEEESFQEDNLESSDIKSEQITKIHSSEVPAKVQSEKVTLLKKPEITETREDRIKNLEKLDFILNGKGDGYTATPVNSKPMSISMVLTPIQGSSLTKFQIKTGTFNFDGGPIIMEKGVLEIFKDKVTIILSQDKNSDPVGIISGSISDSIIDVKPKEYLIHFEDQVISLGAKTRAPIHFTGDWIFSYQ
ncbi:MAG: hypothetical protein ACE5RH_04580 [Nitrosarchaeum sp.]